MLNHKEIWSRLEMIRNKKGGVYGALTQTYIPPPRDYVHEW